MQRLAFDLAHAEGLLVEDNVFLSGAAGLTTAISIDAACSDVRIGANTFNAGITTKVSDAGTGTMGIVKTATLLNNWVAYAGGTATLKYMKSTDGMVHLWGSIKNGTITNGTSVATLPTGFIPSEIIRANAFTQLAGTTSAADVVIDTGGNVLIFYAKADQLDINMAFPAENLANAVSLE